MISRVYLSGAMRGVPQSNFPAFDYAAAMLQRHGFRVVSPADLSRQQGYTGHEAELSRNELATLMFSDLDELSECDAVLLLDGWEQSAGVAVELAYAKYINIPVFQHLSQLLEARSAAA